MNKSPLFASAVILLGILAPAFAADQNHLAMQKMNMMPLSFTQNNGQWADSILFRANAGGATMWFTDGGVYYQFTRRVLKSEEIYVGAGFPGPNDPIHQRDDSLETMLIKATFVGANPNPQMHGEGLMEYKCNYFFGNDSTKWRTDVPNYQAIVFENIYAGIDLKYYGDGRKMEYDFVVSPGADPNQICVKYDGAKSLAVNDAGDLVVGTEWGTVTELAPMVYQMENGERRLLKGAYRLESGDMFSIRLSDEYDPELAVVIDPALAYSTYLGGGISERGYSIAVDSAGCAYLTGFTNSSDFPTQNPYDGSYNGGGLYGHDIFVTKLSASGSALAYSTYLGGNDDDVGQSIAVDNAGCAYLTGYTFSTDFPTQNPYDGSLDGTADAFVVKLSGPGDVLVYSTYLGGGDADIGFGIAVGKTGYAYLTGYTTSTDFPIQNSYDGDYNGNRDAFVAKLSVSGGALVYSTYLGGGDGDDGYGIAVDTAGCAYVTGSTYSTDFPTRDPFDGSYNGGALGNDIFVTKLSASGNSLAYSTYLGGDSVDVGQSIAVDNAGCAYLTGYTTSTDFPTQNSYDGSYNDSSDAFVAKLSASGGALVYSTYLGGGKQDYGYGIAVDTAGCAYVAGNTYSTDFPTQNPYDGSLDGINDAFVAKLSVSGSAIVYSTYLGGSGSELGNGVVIDNIGGIYLTGNTTSTNFPTRNPYDGGKNGVYDAFVVKFQSDYSVINLNNTGPGSLRAVLDSANANPGRDIIRFAVSGTITLASPLPALIDDSTVILGSTAPGGTWSVVLDGSSIAGGGDGLVIQSRDNTIEGLTIKNFPGNGISVTGALSIRNRLSRNVIYNNNGLGIDLGADGVTANDIGDGDTGPNDLLNYPVIDSAISNMDGSYTIYGSAPGQAKVELFIAHPAGDASRPADPSGHGEACTFIDSTQTAPSGAFSMTIPASAGHFSLITATATDISGNTSEFSQNFMLLPAPLMVVAYSPVNVIITDPNGLRFGKDSLGNDITGIPDGHYFITPNDSVVIDHPIEGTYIVQFVTEAGIPVGATYSSIIKIDGTQQLIVAADKLCPASGKVDTTTYEVEEGYHYKNGDGNRDNTLNVGDAVFVVNYIFKGGPAPDPYLSADANCDRTVNIGDAVYVINYIFKSGPSPCHFEP